MSTIYFGENSSGPQYLRNGAYTRLTATSNQGSGFTMLLDIRAAGGGKVEAFSVSNLSWLSPPDTLSPTYTFNVFLNSDLAYSGDGLDGEVSLTVSTRTPTPELIGGEQGVFDTLVNDGDNAFIAPGSDYRKEESFNFDNGQISGTLTLTRVSSNTLSVIGVDKNATDISAWPTSTAVIPKQEFLNGGAGWYEGNSAQFRVDLSKYTPATDPTTGEPLPTGVVKSASEVTTYGPSPIFYAADTILGTEAKTGSGSGLTVKLRATANHGGITSVKSSGTALSMNPSSASDSFVGIQDVDVEGGSGRGGKVYLMWDFDYNVYRLSNSIQVSAQGEGYVVGDIVRLTAANMAAAGMPVSPGEPDELLEVVTTKSGATLVTIVNGGSGYETGNEVSIPNQQLIDNGYISAESKTNMVIKVVVDDLSIEFGSPGSVSGINGGGLTSSNIGSSGGSVGTKLDARSGSKTVRETRSVSSSARASAPDISKDPKTPTVTEEYEILIRNGYDGSMSGAGPYVLDENAPIAYLSDDYSARATEYGQYLKKLILGDAYGVQVTEAMRDEVMTNWSPNQDFRYYDPVNDKLFSMKMDATSWSVSQAGAVMTTSGMWLGDSDGSVGVGSNLEGNAEPLTDQSYSSDAGAPTRNAGGEIGTIVPPGGGSLVVVDESIVDTGSYYEVIEVNLTLSTGLEIIGLPGYTRGGPGYASDTTVDGKSSLTLIVYVTGRVVEAGDTLDTTNSGGVPLGYNGSIVTTNAIIIEQDLFSLPLDPAVSAN